MTQGGDLSMQHTLQIQASGSVPTRRPSGQTVGVFSEVAKVQIMFKNVSVKVKIGGGANSKSSKISPKEQTTKSIIRDISGVIHPARLTAVMGASGAGKTTFLNVLAGFNQANSSVEGVISVNQQPVTGAQMRKISGFVHQEDVILDTMTVREALVFAAMLKLPDDMSKEEKTQRALKVADLLNLTKSLDNTVGSSMSKGISGGEKRRLSLGMEMITNPSILFLDEPTSGLDTYTAHKVVDILRDVAGSHGCTVVATIHQPSSDVFHMFDDLLVLAEGQVMYMGEVEKMVVYFDALGYKCPTYSNPADFLFMDVLYTSAQRTLKQAEGDSAGQLDYETGKAAHDTRIKQLVDSWKRSAAWAEIEAMMTSSSSSHGQLLAGGVDESAVQDQAKFTTQFSLLAWRSGVNQLRNKLMLPAKVMQTIVLSLMVGLIYLNVGNDYRSVQDRQGSLFFLAIQSWMGSLTGTLTVFGVEKAVFYREYGSRMYGLPSYFISRWFVELPSHIILPFVMSCITYWMIGYQADVGKFLWFSLTLILMDNCGAAVGMLTACVFSSIEMAMSMMPVIILPFIVFSGFFVNTSSIPPYFVWISYISPVRYGFQAVGVNEFSGLNIKCKPQDPCPPGYNGDAILDTLGFAPTSVALNNLILFAFMWVCLGLSYFALWWNVRRARK